MKAATKRSPATKKAKRTGAKKGGQLSIREITETADGYTWTTFMVQGFREDGKWKRRKFRERADAEAFMALKGVEMLNQEVLQQVVTTLSAEQVKAAESAFRRLQDRHSLDAVIDYFLRNHHDPDKPVPMKDAIVQFLDSKERDGLQPRSVRQLRSTLDRFHDHLQGCISTEQGIHVHDVSSKDVTTFLDSLRDRDGVQRALRKTWNNVRLDLSSFFAWATHENRKFCTENPVTRTPHFKKKLVAQQRAEVEVLAPQDVAKLFEYLKTFKGGRYCRYYALLFFAGLRPESEAVRLAQHPKRDRLIDMAAGVIELPAEICPKSSGKRTVTIQPNLKAWLDAYPGEILPEKNVRRDLANIRKNFGLSQDIARHSWFTYSIGRDGSVERAALQGGNSEQVVRDHYLSLSKGLATSAPKFWRIKPEGPGNKTGPITTAVKTTKRRTSPAPIKSTPP